MQPFYTSCLSLSLIVEQTCVNNRRNCGFCGKSTKIGVYDFKRVLNNFRYSAKLNFGVLWRDMVEGGPRGARYMCGCWGAAGGCGLPTAAVTRDLVDPHGNLYKRPRLSPDINMSLWPRARRRCARGTEISYQRGNKEIKFDRRYARALTTQDGPSR